MDFIKRSIVATAFLSGIGLVFTGSLAAVLSVTIG